MKDGLPETSCDALDPAESSSQQGMLYNARDVAQRLGVARSTVWRLMDSGELPYVRFGRNRRVEARALLRFIEKHRT